MKHVIGRLDRGTLAVAVVLMAINVWALAPTLSPAESIVAVPLLLVAAYLWVTILRSVARLLGEVGRRVA